MIGEFQEIRKSRKLFIAINVETERAKICDDRSEDEGFGKSFWQTLFQIIHDCRFSE